MLSNYKKDKHTQEVVEKANDAKIDIKQMKTKRILNTTKSTR